MLSAKLTLQVSLNLCDTNEVIAEMQPGKNQCCVGVSP